MEFVINQGRLAAALHRACGVADRRSLNQSLANVMVRATDSGVVLISTDMMVGITERIACDVVSKGALSLRAHNLNTVVRVLPSGDITVRGLDTSWAQLKAGRTEYKMMGEAPGDFPDLPDPEGVKFASVDAGALVGLIDHTIFSVSTDEARVNLNGALLVSDGKAATMVSTDGHRLTKHSVDLKGPKTAGSIIPRKGLEEIRRLLAKREGECEFGIKSGHVYVRSGDVTLSVKLSGVTFPPWEQVLPKTMLSRAKVIRSELLDAFRGAVVIAPSKTSTTALTVAPEALTLEADNPELGSVRLEVPAEWDGEGNLKIGFNGAYLIEALSAIDTDEVELRFGTNLDPIVVAPVTEVEDAGEFMAVVMPMRI